MSNELFSAEVLIALGILAVPTACITYFIYAIAKVKPAARPIPHFPHGVEGWLLVFVATMALSIILTAFSAMNTLSAMNTQGHIYWAAISPAIVTIGLYCYCLWLIARKREAFVVKHTIVILWVVGPISVLLLSLVFGVAVETYAVLRSSVYAMLWTLYFLFSKRVACTYGTKAVDSYVEVALKMAQAKKEQKAKEDASKK